MGWTRIREWLIGAAGMLVVLGIAAAVLWWAASDPAGRNGDGPSPVPGAASPVGTVPPEDLPDGGVWFSDVSLDAGSVAAGGSLLRDVRATGQDVVSGPDGMAAARLDVEATVPFDVVAGELGDGAVVGAAGGGEARVVRTVEAFGRELRVTAAGTVEVAAGRLVVEPRSIDFGGPGFLSDATAAVVRRLVTIEHDVEGLPEGLVLRDVAVHDDGFRVSLRGEDVRLGP